MAENRQKDKSNVSKADIQDKNLLYDNQIAIKNVPMIWTEENIKQLFN